jgi:OmpA-OmpF porin, OOP family
MLKNNKQISIEIQGHTDSTGVATFNQKLSEARAGSVKAYLTQKGVAPHRIATKGFGASLPVAPNNSEQGRALNRRVEVKILGK